MYKTNNAHMVVPINVEANVDKERPPVPDAGVAVCETVGGQNAIAAVYRDDA